MYMCVYMSRTGHPVPMAIDRSIEFSAYNILVAALVASFQRRPPIRQWNVITVLGLLHSLD